MPRATSSVRSLAAGAAAPAGRVAAHLLFALLFTWPLARGIREPLLIAASSPFDALIYLWNFDWLAEALRAGHSPLWTDRLFFPERVPLALYTPTWVQAAISLPVQAWIPGTQGLFAAFHGLAIASFAVASGAVHALARRSGASHAAGFVAGAAFAWSGMRMANLPRPNVLASEWIVLALLALLAVIEGRGRAAVLALALLCAALVSSAPTHALGAAVALPILGAAWWRSRTPGAGARLCAAIALAALLCVPLVPGWVEALGWPAVPEEAGHAVRVRLSLDAAALVWPSAADWPLSALPALRRALPLRPVGFLEQGFSFFAGFTVLLLVAAAFVRRAAPRHARAWSLLALAGLLLALGPELKLFGSPVGLPLPGAVLEQVVAPLRIARAPARFGVLVMLPLALAAAAGFDALARAAHGRTSLRVLGAALLAGFIALEGGEGWPLRRVEGQVPRAEALAAALAPLAADAAVLDLPYDTHHTRRFAMFFQTAHDRPILFADYPRAPRSNRAHFADSSLFVALADPSQTAASLDAALRGLDLDAERARLRRLGIGALVLHHGLWGRAAQAADADVARVVARGRVIAAHLGRAWGAPERVAAGFYEVLLFRL